MGIMRVQNDTLDTLTRRSQSWKKRVSKKSRRGQSVSKKIIEIRHAVIFTK